MNLSRNAGGTVTTCAQAWAALCTSTEERMLPTMIFAGAAQAGRAAALIRDAAGEDADVGRACLGAQHRLPVGEAGRQVDPYPLPLQPSHDAPAGPPVLGDHRYLHHDGRR